MIRLMHTHGRSGGTLLNRILGRLPDVVVMSEVLPRNIAEVVTKGENQPERTIWKQASRYYDIALKEREYIPSILELEDICQRTGRHLVVREWTTCLYLRSHLWSDKLPHIKPSLYTLEHLPPDKTRPFALARTSIDVYKSRLFLPRVHRKEKRLPYFSQWYRYYARDIASSSMPIYHYEALCRHPMSYVKKICDDLELPFDKKAVETFYQNEKVKGSTLKSPFRDDHTKIQQSKKRTFPYEQELKLRHNDAFLQGDELLGAYRESFFSFIIRYLKALLQMDIEKSFAEYVMVDER